MPVCVSHLPMNKVDELCRVFMLCARSSVARMRWPLSTFTCPSQNLFSSAHPPDRPSAVKALARISSHPRGYNIHADCSTCPRASTYRERGPFCCLQAIACPTVQCVHALLDIGFGLFVPHEACKCRRSLCWFSAVAWQLTCVYFADCCVGVCLQLCSKPLELPASPNPSIPATRISRPTGEISILPLSMLSAARVSLCAGRLCGHAWFVPRMQSSCC